MCETSLRCKFAIRGFHQSFLNQKKELLNNNKLFVIKGTIFAFICSAIAYACDSDSSIPKEIQPYSHFHGIQESIPIDQRVNLIPEVFLDSTNIVDSLRTAQRERGFNVASMTKGGHLFFLWGSNQLYYITPEGKASLIAEAGNDPYSIQAGVRLSVVNEQFYLVQRARISEVVCDPECILRVLNTYDYGGSGFINSLYPYSSDFYVISSYNRIGEETIHLVNKSFDILESKGEYFHHSNPSLVADYNFADLSANRSGDLFAHVYNWFPFIALFNFSFELKEVFRVYDFFDHRITAGLSPFALGYERNFMEPASTIVTVNPLGEDQFWVIVVHQRHLERQVGFESVEIAQFFDYYILEEQQGLTYVGSLQDYAVPVDEYLYILKDQMVYRVDVSVDRLSETKYGEFELPEGF